MISTESGRRRMALVGALALTVAACGDDSGAGGGASEDAGVEATGENDGASGAAPAREFYGGHQSELYSDEDNWLCLPGRSDDVCAGDLDTTVVHADGTTEVVEHEPAEDPPIDCFYVYPTVSGDDAANSDLDPGESEELYVTRNHAARFTEVCDVYAPVYRQMTLSGIGGSGAGAGEDDDPWAVAYDDVLDAFRHYIDNHNDGRGVVLIGHSQGSALLKQLIAEEIDAEPELRDRLVSALLLGWPVNVDPGGTVGGDFENIPGCSVPDETGCVVSYSSFRSDPEPPERPAWGHRDHAPTADPEAALLCVNPADPAAATGGGDRRFTSPYLMIDPPDGALSGALDPFDDPARTEEIGTPFVTFPDYFEVECRADEDMSYLAVTMHGDADGDDRADDLPVDLDLGGDAGFAGNWGLHLVDVSLAQGDLIDLVAGQAEAHG